jgi:hypothetical protein
VSLGGHTTDLNAKGDQKSNVFNKGFGSVATEDGSGDDADGGGGGGIGHSCRSGGAHSGGRFYKGGGGDAGSETKGLYPALLADRSDGSVGHGPRCGPGTSPILRRLQHPRAWRIFVLWHCGLQPSMHDTSHTTENPSYMLLSRTVHASEYLP